MRNIHKIIFIIFFFLPTLSYAYITNSSAKNNFHLQCQIQNHYSEQDLLKDIQEEIPFENAILLYNQEQEKIKILFDSQGNDESHHWIENFSQNGDAGNPYFTIYRYGNTLIVESNSYGLRSVKIFPCLCSYRINAAPDAFLLTIPCIQNFPHIILFQITYFS